jgi:hypothetical protein
VTPVELVSFHHAGGGSASFHPLRRTLAALGASEAVTAVARVVEDVALEAR